MTATRRVLIGAGIGLFSGWMVGPAAAQNTVLMRDNPTECEVAAALGVDKPGCPPLAQAPLRRPVQGPTLGVNDRGPPPGPPGPPAKVVTSTAAPPAPPAAVKPAFTASFQIRFEFGSARLTGNAASVLDLVGAAITAPKAKGVQFRIVGHTDGVGSASRNQKLSETRAQAVKAYLLQHFTIDSTRLQALGRGSRDLINPGNPAAAENRRVEISNLGS